MIRLLRAWVALWDRREPATALAAVRIATAIVLLYDYAVVWRLDLIEALWAMPPDGYATGGAGRWAARWLGTDGASALALWRISMIALVCVATGTLTRVACVVAVLASAQLAHRAPDADRGIDGLIRIVLLVLALSRSHAIWSVDAWLWRKIGRPVPAEIPAWPRYLLLLQLVWVYFSGGHNKTGWEWGPLGGFTALANALSDPHFARFDPGWVGAVYPLTRAATAATMAFELGAPLMLLFTYYAATADRPGRLRRLCNRLRLRWIWIGLGVAFHLGIALTLRLGIFPAAMLALYPVLLFPEEIARLQLRLRLPRRQPG
ncbi:MAG TPA: HTTM domain-containing protein [Kofleriaceae bacterium]|nr:HTTM domain-containing protein [Kofleriaceae bacterium]